MGHIVYLVVHAQPVTKYKNECIPVIRPVPTTCLLPRCCPNVLELTSKTKQRCVNVLSLLWRKPRGISGKHLAHSCKVLSLHISTANLRAASYFSYEVHEVHAGLVGLGVCQVEQ